MERAATLLSRAFVWDLNQWSPAGLLPLTHNTNNTNNNHPDPISSPLPQTRGHFGASCIPAINMRDQITNLQRYINNIFQITAARAGLKQQELLGKRNALKISIIFYWLCKCFEDRL